MTNMRTMENTSMGSMKIMEMDMAADTRVTRNMDTNHMAYMITMTIIVQEKIIGRERMHRMAGMAVDTIAREKNRVMTDIKKEIMRIMLPKVKMTIKDRVNLQARATDM